MGTDHRTIIRHLGELVVAAAVALLIGPASSQASMSVVFETYQWRDTTPGLPQEGCYRDDLIGEDDQLNWRAAGTLDPGERFVFRPQHPTACISARAYGTWFAGSRPGVRLTVRPTYSECAAGVECVEVPELVVDDDGVRQQYPNLGQGYGNEFCLWEDDAATPFYPLRYDTDQVDVILENTSSRRADALIEGEDRHWAPYIWTCAAG